ncbi:MAG: phosphotransferase [Gammaproteobacteria bacterium]|nr:phosphotransferase [Gammaproteobacteria bacterium]MDH5631188.1 phosphotransferase [Gammaproteobacteria bacterium]
MSDFLPDSVNKTDIRKQQLSDWVSRKMKINAVKLITVSGDASFRRYFRFEHNNATYIAVDAPPQHEDNHAFERAAKILWDNQLNVPEILAIDLESGFMLLSDLGDDLYLSHLTDDSADQLYHQAIDNIIKMQCIAVDSISHIPPYDDAELQFEMSLFTDWLIPHHLKMDLTSGEQKLIQQTFAKLCDSAKAQPQYFVHRDYHSRNLMLTDRNNPAIIDFQDAVLGPVSYDLVSLLKDSYIGWPEEKIDGWCRYYYQQARNADLIDFDYAQFIRYFDLMGMQRQIKILGIFCRLFYRDGKDGYLKDMPLTFNYLSKAALRYNDYHDFYDFLMSKVKDKILE